VKKIGFVIWLALLISRTSFAQGSTDACHVYWVDVKAAQQAFESLGKNATRQAQARALSSVMRILGEFTAKVGEEELTTRSFPFPDSKQVITASVFYTDESMPHESVMLAVVISDKAQESALSAPNNAVAEVNYDQNTKAVRVRKYVEMQGRFFLVGLQCNRKVSPASK
jgi:hypothetical protein